MLYYVPFLPLQKQRFHTITRWPRCLAKGALPCQPWQGNVTGTQGIATADPVLLQFQPGHRKKGQMYDQHGIFYVFFFFCLLFSDPVALLLNQVDMIQSTDLGVATSWDEKTAEVQCRGSEAPSRCRP